MKIIHTSDWHLGHSLYNYERSEEQQAFLEQLRIIVGREQPDVLLICGDIYHTTTPSSATQKMYTDGLLAIHKASPDTRIIITAGNHDSCAKLEIDRNLWRHFNVTVIGNLARNKERETDWEQHLIEVTDRQGAVIGYIGAVPHVYPHNFPSQNGTLPRNERQAAFFQTLLDLIRKKNTQNLPVVLTAHLAIKEQNCGEDTGTVIGGMDTVPQEELGEGYDYLALGHIHHPHLIRKGYPMANYCGSPLAVDFDEDYPHSVTIAEMERHGEIPLLRRIDIENPRPLTTLPSQPADLEEAFRMLEEFPAQRKDYIRVYVKADRNMPPDLVERISALLHGKDCRFCYVKMHREETARKNERPNLSIEELKQKSPVEIARMYYEEKEGIPMDEELCRLMSDAWREVERQNREEQTPEPEKII